MKFIADENIELSIVDGLKALGIDITSISGMRKKGLIDDNILFLAKSSEMAIITRDSDFLRLHSKGYSHNGIIFIGDQLPIGRIIGDIEKISMMFEKADLENAVIFIPIK